MKKLKKHSIDYTGLGRRWLQASDSAAPKNEGKVTAAFFTTLILLAGLSNFLPLA